MLYACLFVRCFFHLAGPAIFHSPRRELEHRTSLRVPVHIRMYQQTATSEDHQTPEVRRCRSDGDLLVDQGDRRRSPESDEAGDEEAGKPVEGVGGSGSGAARARPSGLGGPGGVKVAMTPARRGSGGRAARQPPVSSRSERKPPRYSISAAGKTVDLRIVLYQEDDRVMQTVFVRSPPDVEETASVAFSLDPQSVFGGLGASVFFATSDFSLSSSAANLLDFFFWPAVLGAQDTLLRWRRSWDGTRTTGHGQSREAG